MEKIDFLPNGDCGATTSCTSKALVEGCSNGVSYLVLLCDSDCGVTSTLKYFNTATGLVENTPPIDFTLGTCSSKTFKVGCKPYLETETFIATAGQTSFTLANVANGDVRFSRNGSTISDLSATVAGSTVTYVPAENNSEALLAGDRIDISYVYSICDSTVTPYTDCIGNEILDGEALVKCSALDPTNFVVDPATGNITVTGGTGGGVTQAELATALDTIQFTTLQIFATAGQTWFPQSDFIIPQGTPYFFLNGLRLPLEAVVVTPGTSNPIVPFWYEYIPAKNGGYVIQAGDRFQIDTLYQEGKTLLNP